MNILQSLFGMGKPKSSATDLLDKGALIIDVRTQSEFRGGHIEGSKNMSLNEVPNKLKEIKSYNMPLVLVCRSGNRSGQATAFLKREGVECENGGSWRALNNYILSQ